MPRRLSRTAVIAARFALGVSAAVAAAFAPLVHAQPAATTAGADGARVYAASCVACHQPGGTGIAGAFPPLANQVPALLSQPGGRDYLIKVVLFGLEGRITVDGAEFQGVMPPWNTLSDAEIAAVLNYVSDAWGNQTPADFRPFAADDVKSARQQPRPASTVLATRPGGAATGPGQQSSVAVTFTAEQAGRGKALYTRRCVDCHGSTLDNGEFGGAPLNGAYFKEHWGVGSVAGLIAYTKAKMPPDGPGSLSDQSYVDLVAYLLDANGYARSDKELPADPELQQTMSLQPRP